MSLFKSASTVSLLTLVSRITGLLRETLVAAVFGASAQTDAFNMAFRIPNFFRRLFAEGAFSQAFVPVLAQSKELHGEAATKLLIDRVASLLLWVLLITCIVGVIAAPLLMWAMAHGWQQSPQTYHMAELMTRIMFPYIGFMSMVALASGVLNTWRRFAVSAATPVLLNVAMIAAAWLLAPQFGRMGIEPIYAMTVGVIAGGMMQLGVQIPALARLGLLPRMAWRWADLRAALQDAQTRRIGKLMLPALLGVSVAQISLLINSNITSYLPKGSLTWLQSSDRLMEFPTAMLGVALGVVLMPQLAAVRNDAARYSSLLDWGLRMVVLLAVPSALALLLFTQPLVAVLYHNGKFTAFDVHQTALALMGWGVGLVGIVAVKVLAPSYYANQDIKTPVRIAILVLVVTQLLNLFFVPWLAHAGLSLSIGVGALLNATLLLAGLLRRGSYTPEPGWGRFLLQVVAASAVLGGYLFWANGAFDWFALQSQRFLRLGLLLSLVAGAGVVYLGVIWALGLNLRKFIRR